ncbi:replication initiation protein [Kocuria sp. HSID16901]|uniref:replication initiation protein n=1 Tax=Kocuria sp. HSID16901 TaxID=2419505 RepID=UPI000F879270|nr:replication initiation protein [Kocuria sp. HSID16901]RUQ19846.1 hypothetical protein D8M21_11025 [Kocuria sp. HSID16901]
MSSVATSPTSSTPPQHAGSWEEQPRPDDAFQRQRLRDHHRLTRFDAGVTKHHCARTSDDPRNYPFIQINAADWKNFVVVDVDHADAYERILYPGIPRPDWIITNPANGHAQAGWVLDTVFTGEKSAPGPALFYRAVATALTNAVGGDHHFTCHIVRNPFADAPTGPVEFSSRTTPWRLGELKAHLTGWTDPALAALGYDDDQPAMWNPYPPQRVRHERTLTAGSPTAGRNCHVFYRTRSALWRLADRGQDIQSASYEIAHRLNDDLGSPLGPREVDGIAASAIRQVKKGNGRPATTDGPTNPWLARLGAAGGRARTAPKITAAQQNLAAARRIREHASRRRAQQAWRLRRAGEVVAAIAEALKVSTRTVKRYLAAARIQHRLKTLAWVARGGDTHQASGVSAPPLAWVKRLPRPLLRALLTLQDLAQAPPGSPTRVE